MPRIPNEEIDRLKRDTDLVALVQSRGIDLKKHGSRDYIGLCPFHNDKETPNFIISPHKGLYHCMGCGAAGNAIQFLEKHDGVSFRHAYELLANGGQAAFQPPRRSISKNTTPKLESPLDHEADDADLLDQVVRYYQERLAVNQAALDYLAWRGLDDDALIKRYRLGFADRSLGLRLPHKNRKDGATIRGCFADLGIYRKETGHEHFNGCIVVPIFGDNETVSEIYGRRITKNLPANAIKHLYLPGPHRGLLNPDALKERELILCESIFDALTFIRHGMEAATCIYGTEGFTDELYQAIKARGVESIRLAYDADDPGERAAQRDAAKLQAIGIECHRIRFSHGLDANEYARRQGGDALRQTLRNAEWLGAGSSVPVPSSSNKIAAKLVAEEPPKAIAPPPLAADKEEVAKIKGPELNRTGEHHQLQLGPRTYRVGGLERNDSLDVMKITLRLWHQDNASRAPAFHIDQLDLYHDTQRRKFIERAAAESLLEPELIKRDLGKLLLALEQQQEQRLHAPLEEAADYEMEPEEHTDALTFLKSPDLITQIIKAFNDAGIIGEDTNKIAAYLACTSRKLAKPLAIIIQSTSAAGKTTVMEAVLSFFPGEDQVKYSAMTGQSLYYLGETNLKNKILAIVEEEGAEKASYALKLLQSEGELTIASTGKDANTGRMETQEYHVEGPVAIILTTASIDIDEELMNRCLVLTVDESREQTERIHTLQRQARTLEGLRLKKRREKILTLLQNAQRLLKPVSIINPYADRLTFTADRTRTRRDHEKYLTLIESVTLLYQHQRPIEQDAEAGPHIKTTLEDIQAANQIAPDILGRSLDELPPQTRRLLDAIKVMVTEQAKADVTTQDQCHFSRRDIRERTGWTYSQVRRHLDRLTELEYITPRSGRNGSAFHYELLVDAQETQSLKQIGLLNIDQLATLTP